MLRSRLQLLVVGIPTIPTTRSMSCSLPLGKSHPSRNNGDRLVSALQVAMTLPPRPPRTVCSEATIRSTNSDHDPRWESPYTRLHPSPRLRRHHWSLTGVATLAYIAAADWPFHRTSPSHRPRRPRMEAANDRLPPK